MRAELERVVAGVDVRAGTAEAIPLLDAAVDAVTVAQAFHWFRFDAALAEIRRVLRPGGAVALLWNRWDPDDRRYAALEGVLASVRREAPYRTERWREALVESPLFGPVEDRRFLYEEELELEHAVQREGTTSLLASLPAPEREAVLDRIREALKAFGEPVRFRCWTEVFVAVAR